MLLAMHGAGGGSSRNHADWDHKPQYYSVSIGGVTCDMVVHMTKNDDPLPSRCALRTWLFS